MSTLFFLMIFYDDIKTGDYCCYNDNDVFFDSVKCPLLMALRRDCNLRMYFQILWNKKNIFKNKAFTLTKY